MPSNVIDVKTKQSKSRGARWTRGFTVLGHRGAAGLVAENTLPSFQRAAELGCSAVELDVYAVDDELLVIHDDTLNRTTNGKGSVAGKSLKTLRQLDAGGASAPGAQIPLLSEVFACLPARIAINIELKGPGTAGPVARALAAWQPRHPLLVSSFDHAELFRFRALMAEVAVAPLFHKSHPDMLQIATNLDACAINLNHRIASQARLKLIRAAGFGAVVYTVNHLRSAKRLLRDGATGVFTDRPDRISSDTLEPSKIDT